MNMVQFSLGGASKYDDKGNKIEYISYNKDSTINAKVTSYK